MTDQLPFTKLGFFSYGRNHVLKIELYLSPKCISQKKKKNLFSDLLIMTRVNKSDKVYTENLSSLREP